jgi:hypothetical protein
MSFWQVALATMVGYLAARVVLAVVWAPLRDWYLIRRARIRALRAFK